MERRIVTLEVSVSRIGYALTGLIAYLTGRGLLDVAVAAGMFP